MGVIIVLALLAAVIWLYFKYNPLNHSRRFMMRRFINWFPLGMSYAFLYMARYNLNAAKVALGPLMDKESFGLIFGAGTVVYGLSFLLTGPLVDRIGGKKGILIATCGASIANVLMGVLTYLFLHGRAPGNITFDFAVLYALNMFFQSYGAVSIIKVKAYWFHVRERGIFGAIFGTLISLGVYFAFDWGTAIADAAKAHVTTPGNLSNIFHNVFGTGTGDLDAVWLLFYIPAAILVFWALLDLWLIKDTPAEANLMDFDTHDASSGSMDREYTKGELLKAIFTSPIIMMIAAVEFTTGVIRNGVMQWYLVFVAEVPQVGALFFKQHWGLILCVTGIIGGFLAGFVSDRVFGSRRSPPVAIASVVMMGLGAAMAAMLFSSPIGVGTMAVILGFLSIGIHSLMSGTAAADFGGRKMTATASGITDGFVYLGTGLQSVCLGYLTTRNWIFWPLFLIPFAALGALFAIRMWSALPEATRRYLATVEKIKISAKSASNLSVKLEVTTLRATSLDTDI